MIRKENEGEERVVKVEVKEEVRIKKEEDSF